MTGAEWIQTATLGGGCFWCLEALFGQLQGVVGVRSGYSGGHVPSPSYEQVCGGKTGHAEVVQVDFDSRVLAYRELLEIFFSMHDPTTPDQQGADVGPQYRSIILTHSPEQKEVAEELIADLARERVFRNPIVTEVASFEAFYPAEKYHQEYYWRNRSQPYCRFVIDPKVEKFREKYAARLKGAEAKSE
ncbi:MAG: peptide-methionine (S)-S-oxide reductase [Candidatus Latescibacterota bacterium]|nr:MAG: peptide-methionine (S)-S-oxide reductase [Candidatus Latescibacterota bacterium]